MVEGEACVQFEVGNGTAVGDRELLIPKLKFEMNTTTFNLLIDE